MNQIIALIAKERLLHISNGAIRRSKDGGVSSLGDAVIYRNSVYRHGNVIYFIGTIKGEKNLFLASRDPLSTGITGPTVFENEIHLKKGDISYENYLVLKKNFPFIIPMSLRKKRTTIGCGDRLGKATPGQLRAIARYDAYPVLAQQSIRELTLTKRTYKHVVADAAFLVFQEGYERGYGADGDHLKTIADIDTALDAGMPMITLDLTNVMNPSAAALSDDEVESAFAKLPADTQNRIVRSYAGKTFRCGSETVALSAIEAKRCALMYGAAMDFSKEVNEHIRAKRGTAYDLEISIDETTTPTLPSHHLYIIKELNHRSVLVNSLAPRFIGEFQKGIDYIGSIDEFERQFRVHCAIAKANGNYKISVHSGSDKFSAFPIVGKYTGGRLHLKTAGTSWLEAMRTIAMKNPALYRSMHEKAFSYAPDALKLYHITADFKKIPPLDGMKDSDLGIYLQANESRQLLHITYGGLLNDSELRAPFFETLARFEGDHYANLSSHFEKHLASLGIRKR
ncbi:MAG: hypothetical protein HZC28_09480 [Spirochaetes bacterium]|nr:hypothetical protein [Spirochaetota bacterium]